MITLPFDPGANKLLVVKAIKDTLGIGLREAKDALDLRRVECKPEDREKLVHAIESAGGKVM